jgi:hypothetical protein
MLIASSLPYEMHEMEVAIGIDSSNRVVGSFVWYWRPRIASADKLNSALLTLAGTDVEHAIADVRDRLLAVSGDRNSVLLVVVRILERVAGVLAAQY